MSRIGKLPIPIPHQVTITITGQTVYAKGPKGELSWTAPEGITIVKDEQTIRIQWSGEKKNLYGVSRTMVANLVQGVSQGFEKKLEIQGVGYRTELKGQTLILSLGYSHPIEFRQPQGITISIDQAKKNILTVSGCDKQMVGETAAAIRSLRPPEPYKGKGIRYVGEIIKQKAGKAAAAKTGAEARTA